MAFPIIHRLNFTATICARPENGVLFGFAQANPERKGASIQVQICMVATEMVWLLVDWHGVCMCLFVSGCTHACFTMLPITTYGPKFTQS